MEKRINIEYIFLNVLYQFLVAAAWGFGSYVLMAKGFDSAVAGYCLSLVSIFSFILQPLISNKLDKTKKITLFEVEVILSALFVILSFINYKTITPNTMLAVVFVTTFAIYSTMEPFINGVAGKFTRHNVKVDYSRARGIGSLSYGIMCIVYGKLSTLYGFNSIDLAMVCFAIGLFIMALTLCKEYRGISTKEEVETKEEIISFGEFVKNNKYFLLLCLSVTLMFLGYNCIDCFMNVVVTNVGGDSGDMGYILGFKAILEAISITMIFPLVLKKLKIQTMLKISAISFIAKSVAIVIAPNIFFLYAAQIFQITSFSFLLPSMVEHVNRIMANNEINRGQSCITMSFTLGSIFSNSIAGNITKYFGVHNMELVALAITLVSVVLLFIFVDKKDIKNGKVQVR